MQFETNHIKIQGEIDAVWKSFNQFKDQVNKTLVQLEISIKVIIDILFPQKAVFRNMLKIIEETQDIPINQTFNEMTVAYNQMNNYQIVSKTVEKIQKKLQLWRKKIVSKIKLDNQIIPNLEQEYLFCEELKFPSIQLLENCTQIQQTASQNHYCFAVVDQPLYNNRGPQTVTFKLTKQVGDVGFGFCDMEIIKAKNFRPQLNILGNGVFICFQDRYIVNSNDATQNWVVKGFPMKTGEQVSVIFDPDSKKMIWKKPNNEGYQFKDIDLTKEYRFCCVVKSQGCEVELLNE